MLAGLAAVCLAASGCGSDPSEPGAFEAHSLVVLGDGGVAIAGAGGRCGKLVLRRLGPGTKEPRAEVDAEGLGGDCVMDAKDTTVGRKGVDVLGEVKDETRGLFESDVLMGWGIARLTTGGEPVDDFGEDGTVKDLSESAVTFPDGSIADTGERLSSSGQELSDITLPLDITPGEESMAPGPGRRLFVAGPPRGRTDQVLVARLGPGGRLDREFAREGILPLPLPTPVDLLPVGQAVIVRGGGGELVRLDERGRVDRSFGRSGVSLPFGRQRSGVYVRLAAARDGGLAALLLFGGRVTVVRLRPDGRRDRRFSPAPLPLEGAPSVPGQASADLSFAPDGRLLVLLNVQGAAVPRLIALDERGRRVPPLPGKPLVLDLG